MLLISGHLMIDKSNNQVHIKWLPLLADFGSRMHTVVSLVDIPQDSTVVSVREADSDLSTGSEWTPYADSKLHDITLDWARSGGEWGTWLSVVPFICFNIMEFHQDDRVNCQFGSEQLILGDLVNVDKFLTTTGREEDVWRPTHLQEWYDSFMSQFEEGHMISIQPTANDKPT
ncbi:uncharacterized protein DS421_17g583160 [Arachis hypogaea]|nr:uncharacterized protein DS421_17g583160 [Arachis hypogaea]